MVVDRVDEDHIDFDTAAIYLALARAAHEDGNETKFIAARKLLMVSLCVSDTPPTQRAR